MAVYMHTNVDGTKIPKYRTPDKRIIFKEFQKLEELFNEYLKNHGLEALKLPANQDLIQKIHEITIRVDKRKDFFFIFQKEIKLCEVREAALIAYWLIKIKPFKINDTLISNGKTHRINEGFAAFLILSAIKEARVREGITEINISDDYFNNLLYAFQYWDISKDAMMIIAETLFEVVK